MKNNFIENLKRSKLTEIEFLSLLSAAAVLRKYEHLKNILGECKERKISGEKIYEALLQTYLFAGFPSALNSLKIFNQYFPDIKQNKNSNKDFYKAGIITCKKIYGKSFEKLKSNIKSFSPEMSDWFIEEGYGKVLSRKKLNIKERELCIISILTVLKFESQLYSHINGASRQKATLNEIEKVILNLDLIGNVSYSKFGLKVFFEFRGKL